MYVESSWRPYLMIADIATGGGMPTSKNRTLWPIKGGAISIQPGWFPGHSNAQFYFNMGYGNEPLNYSHSMAPAFSISGPSNNEYNGTFCMPQVPLPSNYDPKVGDNATIQVIELAQHGAALYNVSNDVTSISVQPLTKIQCVDITFAEPDKVAPVTKDNCFNSTQTEQKIGFQMLYTTTSSPAPHNMAVNAYASILALFALGVAWL
jgi:hypothetical protein